jgi:hypothetical protein
MSVFEEPISIQLVKYIPHPSRFINVFVAPVRSDWLVIPFQDALDLIFRNLCNNSQSISRFLVIIIKIGSLITPSTAFVNLALMISNFNSTSQGDAATEYAKEKKSQLTSTSSTGEPIFPFQLPDAFP